MDVRPNPPFPYSAGEFDVINGLDNAEFLKWVGCTADVSTKAFQPDSFQLFRAVVSCRLLIQNIRHITDSFEIAVEIHRAVMFSDLVKDQMDIRRQTLHKRLFKEVLIDITEQYDAQLINCNEEITDTQYSYLHYIRDVFTTHGFDFSFKTENENYIRWKLINE